MGSLLSEYNELWKVSISDLEPLSLTVPVWSLLLEEAFSGWKTGAAVYGKKAMAGQGISLWDCVGS